jgi:hypothetical protein
MGPQEQGNKFFYSIKGVELFVKSAALGFPRKILFCGIIEITDKRK